METLPGRCGAGLQMGWVRAKEEEGETWKPECAWMAGGAASNLTLGLEWFSPVWLPHQAEVPALAA